MGIGDDGTNSSVCLLTRGLDLVFRQLETMQTFVPQFKGEGQRYANQTSPVSGRARVWICEGREKEREKGRERERKREELVACLVCGQQLVCGNKKNLLYIWILTDNIRGASYCVVHSVDIFNGFSSSKPH